MNIWILQNSIDSPPGLIATWLKERGLPFHLCCLRSGDSLPHPNEVDWLISLGGPMSAWEDAEFPYLRAEKELLSALLVRKKTILGICLGGQLLAEVLGGKVSKHTHWEVGWHTADIKGFGPLEVFQWHQDTFSLPPHCQLLATSPACENQAFKYGEAVLALQFHPEATKEWIIECSLENPYPQPGEFVQQAAEIVGRMELIEKQREWLYSELQRLHELTAATR